MLSHSFVTFVSTQFVFCMWFYFHMNTRTITCLTHLTSFSHVGHVFFFHVVFISLFAHGITCDHYIIQYMLTHAITVWGFFWGTSDLFRMWTCSFVFQIFSWCRVDLNAHNHMWFVDSSHVVSYIFFFCIINFFFPTCRECDYHLNTHNHVMFKHFFFKGFMFAFHVQSDIRVCLHICREKYMMYAMWFCANRHMLILHM